MNKTTLLVLLTILCSIETARAQGCVAIRGLSGCGSTTGGNVNLMKGEFLSQAGFRYFQSYRHFRGTQEEKYRVEQGTEVINDSYFLDLSLNYGITDRLYGNIIIPMVYHHRSSMYEHGGNPPNGLGERHATSSQGLSDVRIGLGYWMLNPEKSHKHNFALGMSLKLPTGSYDYKDTFYNQGPERNENREAVVDQSIQPGDGGVGFSLETQSFHSISHSLVIVSNFFYLFNVQETNGVLTRNGQSEFSCPDQFGVRLGTFYNIGTSGFSAYLGGRFEGVPSSDVIGGSAGYRRPGYVISIEPGISYTKQNISFNLSIPFALERNRTQSYEDKRRTEATGIYRHGDAAFADFLVNFSVLYRFGGKKGSPKSVFPQEINLIDQIN
jgi:hypothetical protein